MAPEIHQLMKSIQERNQTNKLEINYDPEKADVFSLGILIASLCCLDQVDGQSDKAAINKQLSEVQEFYPKLHPLVVDMLHPDPSLRKPFQKLFDRLSSFTHEMAKLPFCELEFVSELRSMAMDEATGSGSFERSYGEWVSKGESNMKNNLYGEAIACFLKVYEMIKRGNLPFNSE